MNNYPLASQLKFLIKSKNARHILKSSLPLLNFKRISNILKITSSNLLLKKNVAGLPYFLEVEASTFCNLKCPACPTGTGNLKRNTGNMKFKTFKKIIDEIGDTLIFLAFSPEGEPMLNNDIYKMIKYAKKKNIYVIVSTNATNIKQKDVLDSGLDYLIVCMDGATPKTYSKYRINGNFDLVKSNIESLIIEREKHNSKKPFVDLHFIVNRYNEHEIEDIKRLAAMMNVDTLSIKKFIPPPGYIHGFPKKKDKKILKFLPLNKKYRYVSYEKNNNNRCNRPWISSVITWDGKVTPCCYDAQAIYCFGNILDKSFRNIWNGKEYEKFRSRMLYEKHKTPLCCKCSGSEIVSTEEYASF